jgi:hypothetical protein
MNGTTKRQSLPNWISAFGIAVTITAMLLDHPGWVFGLGVPLCVAGVVLGAWRAATDDR